jgi:hypothetical protein
VVGLMGEANTVCFARIKKDLNLLWCQVCDLAAHRDWLVGSCCILRF